MSTADAGKPPAARRDPVVITHHGVSRVDDYGWLRDTSSPEVLTHLAAERSWYDAATSHSRSLVETLTAEMSSRVPPADRSVSWRRLRCSYYTFTPTGREYPQLFRVRYPASATEFVASGVDSDRSGGAELLFDPADSADGAEFLEVGVQEVSPDERWLAYSLDTTGEEVYRLAFRDLDSGRDLDEVVPRSYYSGAWSADSGTFFYTVHDAAYRPHQVWRHRLGSRVEEDVCVMNEPDARFELTVRSTRSGERVVVTARSRDTTEVWLVDAHHPAGEPTCVAPRRRGVEYDVEHARLPGGADILLVLTNDGATEFRLMQAPLHAPGREHWEERIAEAPAERLHAVDAFADALVLSLRRDGSPRLRVLPLDGGAGFDLAADSPAGTIGLGRNELWDAGVVTVIRESAVSPPTWEDVDLRTGERTVRHRQEAPGHDPDRYLTQRREVMSADGTAVPITLTRHRATPVDGTAPCLLWGYGAYESCDDPRFDPALPSLLDRGVVHVQTHPRGGGERGRWWWLDGRLQHKQHTFDDHAGVAEHLAATGLVDKTRIATRGLSAGGLLQGAVFSQHPDRWRAVVAEVPFVDVVTTMLDQSVPLTANEWDEWGDPRRPADFAWMLAYSPYDNVPPPPWPDLLVTGALHDPRVMVSEPAKWVARLRATDPRGAPGVLFRCELGEGAHAGPTGRYARLTYEAEVLAWLLERLESGPGQMPPG